MAIEAIKNQLQHNYLTAWYLTAFPKWLSHFHRSYIFDCFTYAMLLSWLEPVGSGRADPSFRELTTLPAMCTIIAIATSILTFVVHKHYRQTKSLLYW